MEPSVEPGCLLKHSPRILPRSQMIALPGDTTSPPLRAGILALTLCVCGCTPAKIWVKDGATPAEHADAEQRCLAQVQEEVNPYEDWGSPAVASTATERDLALWQAQSRVFDACMEALGFRLEPAREPSTGDPTRALPRAL